MEKEIIINRMFSGSYLEDEMNIGHEIINLYKPTNCDKYYIYLVPTGDCAQIHLEKEIDGILLVRGINANCVEVLAKATGIKNVFNQQNPKNWVGLSYGREFLDLATKKRYDGKDFTKVQEQKRKNFENENRDQRDFIDKNNINYDGVRVYDLFKKNPETKYNLSLFITFEAEKVTKVKEPFYLVTAKEHNVPGYHNVIINRKRLAGSAAATFYVDYNEEHYNGEINLPHAKQILQKKQNENDIDYTERFKEHCINEKENYKVLSDLLNKDDLWGNPIEEYNPSLIQEDDTFSFLTIAKKEYDELAYSNMFAYFFDKYNCLLEAFVNLANTKYKLNIAINNHTINTKVEAKAETNNKKKGNTDDVDIGSETEDAPKTILREKKNIDILIVSEKNTITIENKIKSDINGKKHDINGEIIRNQLDKYYDYIESTYKGFDNYYFLFIPTYNESKIDPTKFNRIGEKAFKPIYFGELFEAFETCKKEHPVEFDNDTYFDDFLKAIKRHSSKYDNNYEDIMKRKMKKLIEENQ